MTLCECGCGQETNIRRGKAQRFILGHQCRGERYWKMQLPPQLCECGCGEEVNPGNRFIHGHNNRNRRKTPCEPHLCECGCGQETNIYQGVPRRFIYGHQNRGISRSDAQKKAIHDASLREKTPLPNGWEMDKNSKGATNKNCSIYLGCYIAEQVLSMMFKDVQVMPSNNHGFDFICNKGHKIDAKSAVLRPDGGWAFNIDKNKIADDFILLAFSDRVAITPIHIWLIPGNILNHRTGAYIRKTTIKKWKKYELPIDEVIICCDRIRNGDTK